jgi:hypothetical protein
LVSSAVTVNLKQNHHKNTAYHNAYAKHLETHTVTTHVIIHPSTKQTDPGGKSITETTPVRDSTGHEPRAECHAYGLCLGV